MHSILVLTLSLKNSFPHSVRIHFEEKFWVGFEMCYFSFYLDYLSDKTYQHYQCCFGVKELNGKYFTKLQKKRLVFNECFNLNLYALVTYLTVARFAIERSTK